MNQLAIIYIIIFCAVLLAVQGAYWFFTEHHVARGAINRRLLLAKQTGRAQQEVFETLKRERGLIGRENKQFGHLNDLIVQTGLRLDGKLLIGVAFAGASGLRAVWTCLWLWAGVVYFFGNIRRGFNAAFPFLSPKETHCEIFRAAT